MDNKQKKNLYIKAKNAIRALESLKFAALEPYGIKADDIKGVDFELCWQSGMNAGELAFQAENLAEESASEFQAFQHGQVYCYSCDSASCDHAGLPGPGHVFVGYEQTGRPIWKEFFQALLDLGDERTDLLFNKPPELISRVMGRRRLIDEQLVSFGKNSLTYRIWGQVIAGYIQIAELRAAMTVQVIETQDHKLHFQILADAKVNETLAEAPADRRSSFHRIHDAIVRARTDITSLSLAWKRERHKMKKKEMEKKVFTCLKHLSQSIERKGRQGLRRTSHAEVRAQDKRPIHKAREDLIQATLEDFFLDRFKQTIVVLGPASRTHVYNEKGRHITSLILKKDELERRQYRKRYVNMEPEEISDFRNLILAQKEEL